MSLSSPAVNGTPAVGGAPVHVTLGEHEYPCYAQRHAYLTNRLGKAMGVLSDPDLLGASNFVATLGTGAYDLLAVFYPKIMPRFEFMGFPTAEAFEAGEYDEVYDHSPTVSQIRTALETALKVNGLDLVKHLGKVIDLDLLQAYVNKTMADQMDSLLRQN
jgi:hypothetical protein